MMEAQVLRWLGGGGARLMHTMPNHPHSHHLPCPPLCSPVPPPTKAHRPAAARSSLLQSLARAGAPALVDSSPAWPHHAVGGGETRRLRLNSGYGKPKRLPSRGGNAWLNESPAPVGFLKPSPRPLTHSSASSESYRSFTSHQPQVSSSMLSRLMRTRAARSLRCLSSSLR